jgi:ribonuclease D
MAVHFHIGDLPASVKFQGDIAVDTEAMGLNNHRDRCMCSPAIGWAGR